jgi:hypothetical protein
MHKTKYHRIKSILTLIFRWRFILHEMIVGRVLAIYEALDEASPEPVLIPPP